MEFPTGETHGEVRSKYEGYLAKHGTQALWELLDSRDHESAAPYHPTTRDAWSGLLRCMTRARAAEQLSGLKARRPYYSVEMWGIMMDRQRLYRRMDQRVDAMMVAGLSTRSRASFPPDWAKTSRRVRPSATRRFLHILAGAVLSTSALSSSSDALAGMRSGSCPG